MKELNTIKIYYSKIINLILELYKNELENAVAGHCMKITGLALSELEILWSRIKADYPSIDTFIVSEDLSNAEKYISATKLIEYRNKQESPLLVLIPSNSKTAAEDSYGNATFKEIALDGIENQLRIDLINKIPIEKKEILKDIILKYLTHLTNNQIINYLIQLESEFYSEEAIGNNLFLLDLIPDSILINDKDKIRLRLNFNLQSVNLLNSFSKPVYDRIAELPLAPDTLQMDLVQFTKVENDAKSASQICRLIALKYDHLNFSFWDIPDLNITNTKLITQDIRSTDIKIEEGKKVLFAANSSTSKVKIKFYTNPAPKDIPDLKFFKIILMAVDGATGQEVMVLRKLKNSTSTTSSREATVELNSNMIEEGSYFFKVLAEDQFGNVLNSDDDFKEYKIQQKWEEIKKLNTDASKSQFQFKLTCDSEDFDYIIEDNIDRSETQRKDKLSNTLQAYFKYRIEKLKNSKELDVPEPHEKSNIWLNDQSRHNSTFHINYSEKHNYQIIISSKLRKIEKLFLENASYFGHIRCSLKSNSAATEFDSIAFEKSELNLIIPQDLQSLRINLYNRILGSNEEKNGIIETADTFNFIELINSYLKSYTNWIHEIKSKIAANETIENDNLKNIVAELQFLDLVKVKTKLSDGSVVEAILLSPLHPLRLAWSVSLFGVFKDWEEKTTISQNHKDEWSKNLEVLFEGDLSPENNPLIFIDPNNAYKNFLYSGELAYGWGIYLNSTVEDSKNSMTSIARQLIHFFRKMFNITRDNFVESEISQKLVVRHLKNYMSQHPYTDKLIINLFNAGDSSVFADAFVELEKEQNFQNIKYEVRIFKGEDKIIEHGESLKLLINPESNISEEAEAFSQPSKNRLFPKLRFSINNINDYVSFPSKYSAHLSFLVSPFPITVELIKPLNVNKNFYLNSVITDSSLYINDDNKDDLKWNRYIVKNDLVLKYDRSGETSISLFDTLQSFIASTLATQYTDSIPSTQLKLNDKEKVLITHLHDNSDWVITFDKNLGPQIFDQPSKQGKIPFLLDYVPGEEVSGISSYLTTKPTSEILGLLGPHFEEFNIDIHKPEDEKKIQILLEDLRAVSSSLVLQLNSSKNKAFEVIGSAFTKRVLEKKGLLYESFLIPIDLHQNLFENLSTESKSRADNLLISFDTESKIISITIIEIKCRKSIGDSEKEDLKVKMQNQIENTIEALRMHFDPTYKFSNDRLDREIKNKEFKSLLNFYLDRAFRYEYLSDLMYQNYRTFLQNLDDGFTLKFNKLGLIFNFSSNEKHVKEKIDEDLTFFTFGGKLIDEILDPDSDLNTKRLGDQDVENDLHEAIGLKNSIKPFIKQFILPSHEKSPSSEVQSENEHKDFSEPINHSKPATSHGSVSEKQMPYIIRLGKAAGNLNVGISKLVAFLQSKGIYINSNPNSKLSSEQYSLLEANFLNKTIQADSTANEDVILIKSHTVNETKILPPTSVFEAPNYDILIGKSSPSNQYGLLGETIHGKKIAIDLSETNTISLFGVQGGGKSYTIGTISEMVLKNFDKVNILPAPLAGVIFHYSESMDYEPEFTSMIYPNDKESELSKLKEKYGADPNSIEDVIILTPKDKVEERQLEFPSLKVFPVAFNSAELSVQDWLFLLGAVGNDSAYIKQLKSIMRDHRKNITIATIKESVESSELLSSSQKALARQKLSFASEYIDDSFLLKEQLKPGRLIIVDLRDEFIVKDEALGLFVIMLNIFSGVKNLNGSHFNKFIVFDEAHKYMDNKDLTGTIVTAIREMRHKGVSIMIASQDPPSLPNEIIELSSILLMHKFNSPQWLKHIQKSITQLSVLTPSEMSSLVPGEGFLWSTKASENSITTKPIKISTRPRVTKHGGSTIQATGIK